MIYYVFARFSDIHLTKDVTLIVRSALKYGHPITRVSREPMLSTGHNWISPNQLSHNIEHGLIGSEDTVFLYHLGKETFKFLKIISRNCRPINYPKIYIKGDFSGYLPVIGCLPALASLTFWFRWQVSKLRNSLFYLRLFKLIGATQATIIFESEEQRKIFVKYTKNFMKTKVVPNPIFKSSYHGLSKSNDFVAVGNWRYKHQKNPQLLRELFEKLSRSHSCVVIGAGANDFFGDLNIVVFDKLDHEETVNWINQSKFLVSTSRFEGFPNVFLEAINGHTKIISTDYPAARAVQSQGLGMLIDSNSDNFKFDEVRIFGQKSVHFDAARKHYSDDYWKTL